MIKSEAKHIVTAPVLSCSNAAEEGFRLLLCAGLWQSSDFLDGFPRFNEANWKEILRLANVSGTTGIVADGIMMLPQELLPPRNMMMQLTAMKVKLMQSHALHNITIGKIFTLLKELGFDGVLLKGQSAAIDYATPESRHCGDIDIYIGEERIDELIQRLKEHGITCDEEIDDNIKHAVFIYDGLGVELHRYATFINKPSADRRFQKWWKEGAFSSDRGNIFVTSDGRLSPTEIAGSRPIAIMPPTRQAFMLFYHLLFHFMGLMVSFRQICDVARYFHRHGKEIDIDRFEEMLRNANSLKPWKAFGAFLHLWLGMPKEEIPLYDERFEKKAIKILRRFRSKCFYPGKKAWKRPKGRIASKVYTYIHDLEAVGEMLRIFPGDTFWWIYDKTARGIRNVFNRANTGNSSKRAEHYRQRIQNNTEKQDKP